MLPIPSPSRLAMNQTTIQSTIITRLISNAFPNVIESRQANTPAWTRRLIGRDKNRTAGIARNIYPSIIPTAQQTRAAMNTVTYASPNGTSKESTNLAAIRRKTAPIRHTIATIISNIKIPIVFSRNGYRPAMQVGPDVPLELCNSVYSRKSNWIQN